MEQPAQTLEIRVYDRFQVNPTPVFGFVPYVAPKVPALTSTYVSDQYVWVKAHPVRGPSIFYSPRVIFAAP